MTFYLLLSLFPGAVAVVSLMSLVGIEAETLTALSGLITEIFPTLDPRPYLGAIQAVSSTSGGLLGLLLGTAGSLLSASNGVAAFHRALHRVYDTREGRPFLWFRTIVFGDRFPLRYFAEAYELDYYAAFPGCGTQTEPSAATIAFLTEKVRNEAIPTVWYIEFSNHLVADSIAEATGTRTAMFHTCHNVTRAEMDSGATYLSLMENNLETMKACF